MKLIGNYLSPYARRVAVTLNALDMPFKLEPVMVFKDPDAVRQHNPVVRIPVLVLDDGEALVESGAILDAIDEMAGPERALTPREGKARRRVLQTAALAVACMEKAQWAFYEYRFHPEEKVHLPWVEHNEQQVLGGLGHLDGLAAAAGAGGWLAGTATISQADVSTAVAYSFCRVARPQLDLESQAPSLAAFAARCEAMDIFSRAPIPDLP